MSKEQNQPNPVSDLDILSDHDIQSIEQATEQLRDIKIDYGFNSGNRASNSRLETNPKQSLNKSLTKKLEPALEKIKEITR